MRGVHGHFQHSRRYRHSYGLILKWSGSYIVLKWDIGFKFFYHKTTSVRGVRGYFSHTSIYRERYDPYTVMSRIRWSPLISYFLCWSVCSVRGQFRHNNREYDNINCFAERIRTENLFWLILVYIYSTNPNYIPTESVCGLSM